MFQKVNDWLSDRGGRFFRSGEAGHNAGGAYYASQEAEQAYGGMGTAAQDAEGLGDTARTAAADTMNTEGNDPYGGRVPYRSQKDLQADAEMQRRREAEEQARQQQAAYQQQQQTQAYPQASAQTAYQQPSNILPFPGMIRGPEGNLYAHVEYIVLLRSRNECTRIIEYIKANASVFLNMEFIANDSERQRCVDMLSGAAYTMGCKLNKISQRGIYLISSPNVRVMLDPAMQKFAATPESQGYVRPEYANPAAYQTGAPMAGYAAQAGGGYATGVQPQTPRYATGARTAAYANQTNATMGGYAAQTNAARPAPVAAQTQQYAAQQAASYAAGGQTSPYAAQQAASYAAGGQTSQFAAQQAASYAVGAQTSQFAAQQAASYAAGAQTSPYAAQQAASYAAGSQTSPYAAQQAASYAAGAQTSPYAAQQAAQANAPQHRRATAPFGMQGAFVKRAEGGADR